MCLLLHSVCLVLAPQINCQLRGDTEHICHVQYCVTDMHTTVLSHCKKGQINTVSPLNQWFTFPLR